MRWMTKDTPNKVFLFKKDRGEGVRASVKNLKNTLYPTDTWKRKTCLSKPVLAAWDQKERTEILNYS